MLLKDTALANNLAVMSRYAADHDLLLAPHGKTTMAPKLFRRQLEAGAWGMTAASLDQAKVAFDAGAERVIVANEVLGGFARTGMAALLGPGRELYCVVDSVRGAELLDTDLSLAGAAGRLSVLVELGAPGGRAGARTEPEALCVAEAVKASRHLRLAGVEGFEGALASDRSPGALQKVDAYLTRLRQLASRLAGTGAFSGDGPMIISAGGSKYFDRVAEVLGAHRGRTSREVLIVLRSGCYAVHDHGVYAAASPLVGGDQQHGDQQHGDQQHGVLLPALEAWAEVLSRPEPDLAIVGLGKRDVPYDAGLPVPLSALRPGRGGPSPFSDAELKGLDDQHGYLHLGQAGQYIDVGDRVGFGVSHPCTAFDKWRSVVLVGGDYEVLDHIPTFFH